MGGKLKDVRSIVSSLFPQGLYLHCSTHSLNSTIKNATDIQRIRNSIRVMENI
jgi:hypothetical protein